MYYCKTNREHTELTTMHESVVTSFRLPKDTIAALKRASHVESLRTGKDVTVSSLLRDALREHPLLKASGSSTPER